MVRSLIAAWCVASALGSASLVAAGAPLSNDAQPLAVCQETIRKASLRLGNDVQRAVGACLTRGIECVSGPTANREPCCQQAERRCTDDLGGLEKSKARFRSYVGTRRCEVVPFIDITSADGLGYAELEARCAALVPPDSLGDLAGLTSCLARLVVAGTACLVGTQELPRSEEALACAGIEADFRAATGADLQACGIPVPTPTGPTPIVTPTATRSPTPIASPTRSATPTAIATAVLTATSTPMPTATVLPPTVTPGQTATATATPIATLTATRTATPTPSATQTAVPTASATPTSTRTPSPTATTTPVATASPTVSPTTTPTRTASPTATATLVPATATPVLTATATATATRTTTPTVTRTATPTATGSATPVPSVTVTPGGASVCGNGVVDAGEDCDDGNTVNCDSCPSNCKNSTAPIACPTTGVRHAQKIHLEAPAGAVLSGGLFCIDYPSGVVALPGTGNITGRVTGITGGVPFLNDFNNAAQLSFVVNPGQAQLNPIISFDLCTGQTAPLPTAFQCVTKSASNSGNPLDTATVICSPTQ
jgi:cysteine-rich repeat protein